MKYITFAIPSYNSQDYMRRCIDSLLMGGEDVEILIINDGSKDKTGEIASEYEQNYPTICKAIQKENGGHGSGVNKGMDLATGVYYKVVDSDDWLDEKAYPTLLNAIKKMVDQHQEPDLFIGNYIYDHLDEGSKHTVNFKGIFPENRVFTWNDVKNFRMDKNLLMHTLYYKTSVVRNSGVRLPEHTFYVDNIFAFKPLAFCETIVYLPLDLYHYYIGRNDQSVNTKVMCSRIDQQLKVTDMMTRDFDYQNVKKKYPALYRYMVQYLRMMYLVSAIHLDLIGNEEAVQKRKNMWKNLRDYDLNLAHIIENPITKLTDLPKGIVEPVYLLAKKIVKFQ